MKVQSMQFKVLITIISAMLAITIFIGGLSIYEVDRYIQNESEKFVRVTCENAASQINDSFGDMEKSVRIMESYVYGLIENSADVDNTEKQYEILSKSDEMFIDVAKNTDGAIGYYIRFAPEISNSTSGFFYSKQNGRGDFIPLKPTDLSQYDESDIEHVGWYWQAYKAGKPVWMLPYYNLNNDILMISYVIPLYYDDEFFGIVGMDFDYTTLISKVHDIKIYERGFAHLEFEGADVLNSGHVEEKKLHEHPDEYLSVSKTLTNGMNLLVSASYKDIKQIRYDIALKILLVVFLLAVLFSLIAIFIVRKIVYPLKKLTDASIKLSNQDYDVEIIHSNTHEIKLLSAAFENMALQLREHEKLQHLLAYRDSLTGLRNTNSYWAWITDFDKEIETKEIDFGVMVFDINYLKETNDRYGHDVGNKLIVSAARVISDIFKRSPVFRIGGDEFLAILQNRDLDELNELLKKFDEECLNKSVDTDKEIINVSIAKGFARYNPEEDENFIDVFNKADDAMYENKRKIKGLK